MHVRDLPNFRDLPPVNGMPHGCAWGVWDKDGNRDDVGSLNLLTPEVILEAKKEIQHGISVSLNWPLHNVHEPGFSRKKADHKFVDLKPAFVAHDDELHINTQSGSQWDGLRHWAHQSTELYYNGLKHEEISGPKPKPYNGIEQWNKRGGVVGRAVLIDYASWAKKKGIEYSPMSRHCISEKDLEEVAKDQGVEFKPADILIVRSGWIKFYNEVTPEERVKNVKEGHAFVGVEGTPSSLEWLWDHHFAALAGDTIAFEAWPPKPESCIHDFSLALWGTPLGELWDLEELSEVCKKLNKWSFFITSAPLNVAGGVASPPNALAIL